MLCPPHPPAPLVQNWLARHQDRRSLVLHLIGIPPTVIAILILPISIGAFSLPVFLLSLSLFVGGYLIQFLGHALDGTEPGEFTAVKRLAGRLYGAGTGAAKSRRRVA